MANVEGSAKIVAYGLVIIIVFIISILLYIIIC
jgi:hypothetical protein